VAIRNFQKSKADKRRAADYIRPNPTHNPYIRPDRARRVHVYVQSVFGFSSFARGLRYKIVQIFLPSRNFKMFKMFATVWFLAALALAVVGQAANNDGDDDQRQGRGMRAMVYEPRLYIIFYTSNILLLYIW